RPLGPCVFRLSAAWTRPGAHVHRDRGGGVADVAAVVDGAGTQRRRTEWTRDPLVGPRGVSFGGMPRGAVVGRPLDGSDLSADVARRSGDRHRRAAADVGPLLGSGDR